MTNCAEIPPFNKHGVLPEGVYGCREDHLRARFVEEFPDSKTRKVILAGFLDWRSHVAKIVHAATQWIDGSFVTSKLNPGDIDVVTFCDADYLNKATPQQQQAIKALLGADEDTKSLYSTHTFLIASCAPEHPFYPRYEKARKYWRKQWARVRAEHNPAERGKRGRFKGFLEMVVGTREKAPIISHERRSK